MVQKFVKKPVEIEAIQWVGDNTAEVMEFVGPMIHPTSSSTLGIRTLEGVMDAAVGDWIIKGVKGEFYPCKPDIFEMTYDRAV